MAGLMTCGHPTEWAYADPGGNKCVGCERNRLRVLVRELQTKLLLAEKSVTAANVQRKTAEEFVRQVCHAD